MAVLHVIAAAVSLRLGAAVLLRAKGTGSHVVMGRLYVVGMLLVSLPALLVYDITGALAPSTCSRSSVS